MDEISPIFFFFPQFFVFSLLSAISSSFDVFQYLPEPSYSGSSIDLFPLNLNSNALCSVLV
jgi:hypothetical protein